MLHHKGGGSHLWLYISVGDIQHVECGEAFHELAGNISGVVGRTGSRVFEVVGQVTVWKIFHCNEDEVDTRVPAEKFDKKIIALVELCLLDRHRTHRLTKCHLGTYVSYFDHHCNFAGEIHLPSPCVYLLDRPQFTTISLLETDDTETTRSEGFLISPCCLNRRSALSGSHVSPVGRVCDTAIPERGFEFETVQLGVIVDEHG